MHFEASEAYIIDSAINSLDERFEKYEFLFKYFGFLCDISKPFEKDVCKQLVKMLTVKTENTDEKQMDIDGEDLFNEIQILNQVSATDDYRPLSILNYLTSHSTLELYPNLVTA